MISQLYYLLPKRILYWKLSGDVSGEEIAEMSEFITRQTKLHNREKIHLVIDSTWIKQPDCRHTQAHQAFDTLAREDGLGKVVLISRDYQIQVHFNRLSTAFGLNWHNVSTMDEAIRSVKKTDNLLQTVPALLPGSLNLRA